MAKYLFYGSYTHEGLRNVMDEGGSSRIEAINEALASLGGKLEAFYFAFGENDFYMIVDLPDNVSTTAISFAANISGSETLKTVVLLTPEEVDEALKKSIEYTPPGQ
ncbi:MAG: GYD domain-containing protein [Anaerolineales bacterium]